MDSSIFVIKLRTESHWSTFDFLYLYLLPDTQDNIVIVELTEIETSWD